jgi:hypothetical protein
MHELNSTIIFFMFSVALLNYFTVLFFSFFLDTALLLLVILLLNRASNLKKRIYALFPPWLEILIAAEFELRIPQAILS